jgi:hypothetical protein
MRLRQLPSPSLPLLLLALLASPSALAAIQITLSKPGGSLTPADFELTARIQSTQQLSAVQARLHGRTFSMPVGPESRAVISIATVPFGEHTLEVTARDVEGTEGHATLVLQVDRPARVILSSPLPGAVARPSVRLTASCEDDNPEACEISVAGRVPPPPGSLPHAPGKQLEGLSARGQLDQELCLAEHVGEQVILTLTARAGDGPESAPVDVSVFVEHSQRLAPVVSAPGELLDFDEQRLLFVDSQRRAQVMDRTTGQTETLLDPLQSNLELCGLSCSRSYDTGHLVPGGALFLSGGELLLVREGKREHLGTLLRMPASRSAPLAVAGAYVAFEPLPQSGEPEGWRLRNLATGTTALLPSFSALAPNGTVLFSDSSGLLRYKEGRQELLIAGGDTLLSSLSSDGEDVVFQRGSGGTRETVLLRAGQQHVLAETSSLPEHLLSPLLAQGWVAFVRPGSGVGQVWVRSPTGVEGQISRWGTHSVPHLLGPTGTLIYASGDTYYQAAPGSVSVPFASSRFLRLFALEKDTPHVALGNTLFRVDLSAPAQPLTCPQTSPSPDKGGGCATAGSGSLWLIALTLLLLGRPGSRRARRGSSAGRARSAPAGGTR